MALHEEEGEIVQRPPDGEESTHLVILDDSTYLSVQSGLTVLIITKRTIVEIFIASLFPKDHETTGNRIHHNGKSAQPPNKGIPKEINLTMVLDPKVLECDIKPSKPSAGKRM